MTERGIWKIAVHATLAWVWGTEVGKYEIVTRNGAYLRMFL